MVSTPSHTAAQIKEVFKAQKGHQYSVARTSAKERITKLRMLRESILSHRQDICDAMHEDFRKHMSEVELTEVYPVTGAINHTIKNLRRWMRPKGVATPIAMIGTRSWVHYEPKGVILIITPWNYPFNLTFLPLISAVAAGNCVVIKPSEHSPSTSKVMSKIISEVFDPREVIVIQGDKEVSTELLSLPFNHFLFTGGSSVGKIVMQAAAKHLASVTLELGGKSPAIVHSDANLKSTARRIAWGKYTNAGQTCVAPDYLLVHTSIKEALLEELKRNIKKMYGDNPKQSESYCRIINGHHHSRISSYIEDAVSNGANVVIGGKTDTETNYISPTIISDVDPSMEVMKNEIFGPVLPVMTYSDMSEATDYITQGEKPLALYVFTQNGKFANSVIEGTRAGASAINHCMIHKNSWYLPDGGSNNSGIGKVNGEWGFKEFSNERAVLKQWSPISTIDSLMAPYTDAKQKLIDLTIKYF